MNRIWAVGVGLAVLIGLAAVILADPSRRLQSPEARAMRQLQDASIRRPQVQFLRVSPTDDAVVCGLARVGETGGRPREALFVSTPQRVIIGRSGNPALEQAMDRYCRGVFPVTLPPSPG